MFQIVSKLSIFGTMAITARALTPAEFGSTVAIQGVAVLAAVLLDLGTSTMVGRDLAARQLTRTGLKASVLLRVVSVVPLLGLGAMVPAIFPSISISTAMAASAGAVAINASVLAIGTLEGRLAYRQSAVAQGVGRLALVVVSAGVYAAGLDSVSAFMWAFAAGEATTLVATVALSWRLSGLPLSPEVSRKWLGRSLSYWLNSVFYIAYNRVDVALVAALAGSVEAGLYAPASALQNVLMIVPGLVAAGLPTAGAQVFIDHGEHALRRVFIRLLTLSITIGIVVASVATLFAPQLVLLLVGPGYEDSIGPTRILAWSAPLYGAEVCIVGALIATGRSRATTFVYGTTFVSALLLSMWLTPDMGASGAAWAGLLRGVPTVLVAGALAAVAFRARGSTRAAATKPATPETEYVRGEP